MYYQKRSKLMLGISIIRKLFVLLLCAISIGASSYAQVILPYQPEQDACGAISLCSTSFYTPFSYTGPGSTRSEVTGVALGEYYERNTVWFRIKVAVAGNIVFNITPVDPIEDYDYTVFDITGMQCPYNTDDMGRAIVRYNLNCNGNCNDGVPLYPEGKIGLNYTSQLQFVAGGTPGDPFLQYLETQAGEEYLIMVNNFSGSAAGFRIDFEGSTATLQNDGLVFDSIAPVCSASANYSSLKVIFNEPILCSSVAADGSDFTLGPGMPTILSATGTNCTGRPGAYVHELVLKLNGSLKLGETYNLQSKKGTDGTTTIGLCHGSDIQEGYAKAFTVGLPYTINAGQDTTMCAGGSLGLRANLQGGGDVRIRWQPATYLSSNSIANPIASPPTDMEYVVTVAPLGFPAVCHHRDTIRIKVLKGFDILTSDTMLCKQEKIAIQLQGDSEFTYTWSPSDYLSGTTGMLQNAVPKKSIAYTVKASYPGCRDSVQTVSIGIREWPDLVTADTIVCQGQPVNLQVVGNGNFSHIWSPDLYLSNALITNPIARPDKSIIYTLTTSYAGCADSVQSVSIDIEPVPDIAPMALSALCVGSKIQLLPSVAPVGYSNYSYQWVPAVSFNNANSKNAIYTAVNTGLISLRVSTPHGCADTATQLLTVSPLPVVNAGKDITVIEGQGFMLQGTADQTPATIKWTPTRYLSSDNIINPTATLPASQNFVLSVSNEYGCTAKDSVFITVLKDIHIPNAFSPNGDGLNDVWNIPGLASYQNGKTQVFNRWGQMVFESKGYEKPWDGKFKGSQLPIGVYYYIIKVGDGRPPANGSVTILR